MIRFILGLLTMILVAFLFTKIRGFIFSRTKKDLLNELSFVNKKATNIIVNNPKINRIIFYP